MTNKPFAEIAKLITEEPQNEKKFELIAMYKNEIQEYIDTAHNGAWETRDAISNILNIWKMYILLTFRASSSGIERPVQTIKREVKID